jgi:hypothetical protein
LKHKDVEPQLRSPVEAYAWLVTSGDDQGARRLRTTFNQQEAVRADGLATEYRSKYSNRVDKTTFYLSDETAHQIAGKDPVLWEPIRPNTISAADLDLVCGWKGKE